MLIILSEEASMERFLSSWLPRQYPSLRFTVRTFSGKQDMLMKLRKRLRTYRFPVDSQYAIIVLVDSDQDECRELKTRVEELVPSRMPSRTRPKGGQWQVASVIVEKELESWFIGDWAGLCTVYQALPPTPPSRLRDPERMTGKPSRVLENYLLRKVARRQVLAKSELAARMGEVLQPDRCVCRSFAHFNSVIRDIDAGFR